MHPSGVEQKPHIISLRGMSNASLKKKKKKVEIQANLQDLQYM